MSRFIRVRLTASLLGLVIFGCGNGSQSNQSDDAAASDATRMIVDAGPMADGGLQPPDATNIGDGSMVSDAAVAGDSSVNPFSTCDEICDHYVECDRLDLWAGRRRTTCMESCDDAQDLENFPRYRDCLRATPCARLQECRLPRRPRPTCAQVCESLSTCEADARLPGALPNTEDCLSGCDRPSVAADIQRCGEPMATDPESCDEPTFALCMLREQAPDCVNVCEQRERCGLTDDIVLCAIECVSRVEPEDPLARRRLRIEENCAEDAMSCEDFLSCQRPEASVVQPETVQALCQADVDCGFFGDDCLPLARTLIGATSSDTPECAGGLLQNECERGPLDCLRPAVEAIGNCNEYCAAAAVCDGLPEGVLELECAADCRDAIETGDAIRLSGYRAGMRCAYSASCEDFSECLSADSGELNCAEFCERRTDCGIGELASCQMNCDAAQGTLRNWAERTCTAAAADCTAVPKCIAAPPAPCNRLCALLSECDQEPGNCVTECDDAHYVDAESFLPRYACLVSTDRCNGRLDCEAGQLAGGFACLNWCRHRLSCEDGEGDMVSCVDQCAAGLPGQDGLRFEAAHGCLTQAGLNAACEPLSACMGDVEPAALCQMACAEQARCTFADDVPACVQSCTEAVGNDDLEQLQCVLSAIRRQSGCAAVALCLGIVPEPASDNCTTLCGARARCDAAVDVFLCERECTPEPDDLPIRRACSDLAECEQLNLCLAPAANVPANCTAACATADACDGVIGLNDGAVFPSIAACEIICAARGLLSEGEIPQQLPNCLEEAMCEAELVAGCFEGRRPVNCGSGWDAIVACGNEVLFQIAGINNRADYIRTCEEQVAINPMQVEIDLQCLVDASPANGDPEACAGQLICLLGGLGP